MGLILPPVDIIRQWTLEVVSLSYTFCKKTDAGSDTEVPVTILSKVDPKSLFFILKQTSP